MFFLPTAPACITGSELQQSFYSAGLQRLRQRWKKHVVIEEEFVKKCYQPYKGYAHHIYKFH
jgi:hypothetical protein